MSVIYFNEGDTQRLLSLAAFHGETIKPFIRSSAHYAQYSQNMQGLNKASYQEEVCQMEFIYCILYYAFISNRVAYGVQYRESIRFTDLPTDFLSVTPIHCTLKELVKELNHLHYNMNTNAGNFFIDDRWYEPFRDIVNGITRLLAGV